MRFFRLISSNACVLSAFLFGTIKAGQHIRGKERFTRLYVTACQLGVASVAKVVLLRF
jgi:hypothetical protein